MSTMHKNCTVSLSLVVALLLIMPIVISLHASAESSSEEVPSFVVASDRSQHGWLSVQNGRLVDQDGTPVQLRGMSSHGIAWFPEYTGYESIMATRQLGANLFRVAMYVDFDAGNYSLSPEDQEHCKQLAYAAVDNALQADMYVIMDWHITKIGNPLIRVESAIAFFDEFSQRYADEPGVLYEICNEPNGKTTWEDVVSYADHVIPVIRKNAPKAVILVGTPNYSTDLLSSMDDPLSYENIMYTFHYYSALSKGGYRNILELARIAGHPVFVSEWGVGGSGSNDDLELEYAQAFVDYLNEHGVSWANWSLSNKEESFSLISHKVDELSGWPYEALTVGGRLVFEALQEK